MNLRRLTAAAALTIALAVPFSPPAPAQAAAAAPSVAMATSTAKYKFKNCTAMNKVYRHGVGKKGAKDHTSGKAVKTFKVSTALYKKVIRYRSGLDRDKDGIACEKR